jgi:hypothetical protein
MGRPSDYKPEYAEQAVKLCRLGATDIELAEFFDVSVRTIHRWKSEYEEFCHSIKAGKEHADNRVERALYERASGYAFVEQQAIKVKTGQYTEAVEVVDVERQMPPETPACIFWLKNRKAAEWRDKVETELSGAVQIGRMVREIVRPEPK